MCSLVSADPSSRGCAVRARLPSGMTRSDSFSTPLRPPCSICGWPLLTRLDWRRSKTRSMPGLLMMLATLAQRPQQAAADAQGEGGERRAAAALQNEERGGGDGRVKTVVHPLGPERVVERRGKNPHHRRVDAAER